MNRNRFPKRIIAGIAGLGVLAVMAGSIAPVQAQSRGRYDDDRPDLRNRRPRYDDDRRRDNDGRWRDSDNRRRDDNDRDRWRSNDNRRWDDDDRWRDNDDRRWGSRYGSGATWTTIDRRPNLGTNSRPGVYVWRDRDDVFIVVNDRSRSWSNRLSGEVTILNGRLSNAGGYESGRNTRVQQVSQNRLNFTIGPDSGLEGVRFRVDEGSRIIVNLHGSNASRVYLGQHMISTSQNPLVIER